VHEDEGVGVLPNISPVHQYPPPPGFQQFTIECSRFLQLEQKPRLGLVPVDEEVRMAVVVEGMDAETEGSAVQ